MDRCAGRRLAEWLRDGGHDVLNTRNLGSDPGDTALLDRAASDNRVLITVDKDFGELRYLHGTPHAGLVRLPDVRMPQRIALVEEAINHHGQALEEKGHDNNTKRASPDLTGAGTLNDSRGVLKKDSLVRSCNLPQRGP